MNQKQKNEITNRLNSLLGEYKDVIKNTPDGHLIEPYFLMNLTIGIEYPLLLAATSDDEYLFVNNMLAKASFYLQHISVESDSYSKAFSFHQLCSAYIAKHSGQHTSENDFLFNN